MSTPQDINHCIEQAIADYDNANTSNIIRNLREIDFDTQPYALMARTYFVEFDPMNASAKLPASLTRDVGSFICDYVFLQDPNRNQIQVSIEKRNTKIYFTHGWSRLRSFYDIGVGGWVTLLYIHPRMFHIRVRTITGIEVDYPKKNPPYRLIHLERSHVTFPIGPMPYFVAPTRFYHTLEKTLTTADIQSGVLKISWAGFWENAFPNESTNIALIDWCGFIWRCHLEIGNDNPKTCQLSGQWGAICRVRNLVEGMTLKFGVTQSSNNNVIYFKIFPFMGVRTTLIAPITSGGHKAFYQAEQHFML